MLILFRLGMEQSTKVKCVSAAHAVVQGQSTSGQLAKAPPNCQLN
jgi:hypothetical protein